jgi:hypothetical protein
LKEIAKARKGCRTLITSNLIMACTRFPMLVKTPHIEKVGLRMPMLDILYATCKNKNIIKISYDNNHYLNLV